MTLTTGYLFRADMGSGYSGYDNSDDAIGVPEITPKKDDMRVT